MNARGGCPVKGNPLSFIEDDFDLATYRKTKIDSIQNNAKVKDIRRKIFVGKILIAVAALAVSVLLYYLITVMVPLF